MYEHAYSPPSTHIPYLKVLKSGKACQNVGTYVMIAHYSISLNFPYDLTIVNYSIYNLSYLPY